MRKKNLSYIKITKKKKKNKNMPRGLTEMVTDIL